MKLTQNFCNHAIEVCQQADIFARIHNLTACNQLTHQDQLDLETIDVELTAILTKADQWCINQGTHSWSPELHTAYLIHHYWTLKLSQKRMGRNYPQAFA